MGKLAIFDWNRCLSRKWCEIGRWLLWNVNRKSWILDWMVFDALHHAYTQSRTVCIDHLRDICTHKTGRRRLSPGIFLTIQQFKYFCDYTVVARWVTITRISFPRKLPADMTRSCAPARPWRRGRWRVDLQHCMWYVFDPVNETSWGYTVNSQFLLTGFNWEILPNTIIVEAYAKCFKNNQQISHVLLRWWSVAECFSCYVQ